MLWCSPRPLHLHGSSYNIHIYYNSLTYICSLENFIWRRNTNKIFENKWREAARKFVYYFIGGKQLFSDGLNIIFPLQHLILSFAQNSRGGRGASGLLHPPLCVRAQLGLNRNLPSQILHKQGRGIQRQTRHDHLKSFLLIR